MPWQLPRVIKESDGGFSAEGTFRDDEGAQHYRSVNGLRTEAAARQWVYAQQEADDAATRAAVRTPGREGI
jgi:hypothetical protein